MTNRLDAPHATSGQQALCHNRNSSATARKKARKGEPSLDQPLLTTKFEIPPLRDELVLRPRLTTRLDRVLDARLGMVVAPAGFGKTTLVRSWVEECGHPVAWLGLDEQDNNPDRFMRYLIYTFQVLEPTIGAPALALLNTGRDPHPSAVLTLLINDLANLRGPIVLVLDDYHAIVDDAIHRAIDFLLSHAPAHLHLLITSRSQPPLTLAACAARADWSR